MPVQRRALWGGCCELEWIHYLHNPIIHLFYPQKILHNHCLQILQGHEDVLRETKNNAYANFLGVKEVYYGICASSEHPIAILDT